MFLVKHVDHGQTVSEEGATAQFLESSPRVASHALVLARLPIGQLTAIR
jgi:hypothetical protein